MPLKNDIKYFTPKIFTQKFNNLNMIPKNHINIFQEFGKLNCYKKQMFLLCFPSFLILIEEDDNLMRSKSKIEKLKYHPGVCGKVRGLSEFKSQFCTWYWDSHVSPPVGQGEQISIKIKRNNKNKLKAGNNVE